MKFIYSTLLFILISNSAVAGLTYQQKIDDFTQLVNEVKNEYGPLKYKENLLNISLPELATLYKEQINKSISDDDFYYLILKFIGEFKDVHFSASNGSSDYSELGFTVEPSGGKFFISSIDRMLLNYKDFPADIGDELLEINNTPVKEYMGKEISPYHGFSSERSKTLFSSMLLTKRLKKKCSNR